MARKKRPPIDALAALDESLVAASADAEVLRTQLDHVATASDVASLGSARAQVDRFLLDIDEAIKQVFVAGLAYPDPELADELAALSDRARRHGLPSATAGLDRLRILLLATHAERDLLRRQELAHRAWDETQRFVAWLRLFRVEYDLLAIQARLEQDVAESDAPAPPPEFPRASLTAWPLGMDLSASGRLVIFCQDVDSGDAVLFHDHLAEWDRDNPLRAPAISRLFQDSVLLGDVLTGVIRTDEHPVATRRGAWIFRPAFASIPRVLAVADDFEPPPLPTADPGPRALPVHVSWAHGGIHISPALAANPTLRFNLTKLMLRERRDHLELDSVALTKGAEPVLLSVCTGFDGRVFPSHDTALFRIARSVVHARACKVDERLGGLTVSGFWVRAAACLLHGATHAEIDALRSSLPTRRAAGIAEHYRLAYAAFLIDEVHHPDGIVNLLRTALTLAAAPAADAVDTADMARVLGQGASSSADFRLLDGNFVYQTLWLADACALTDDLRDEIAQLWRARYQGELKDPGWGDVVARVLLLILMHATGQLAPPGQGDDAMAAAVQDAEAFMTAHLTDLRKVGGTRPAPELIEWLQLADTYAWLHDQDRFGLTIRMLGVGGDRLWTSVATTLLNWTLEVEAGGAPAQSTLRAGDALAAAVAVDIGRLLVT